MPPIQIRVARDDVLAATLRTRRTGNAAGLHRLDLRQPELAELLNDVSGALQRRLSRTRMSPVAVRRLTRRVELLSLTLVETVLTVHVRHATRECRLVVPQLT